MNKNDFDRFVTTIFRSDMLCDGENILFWFSTNVGVQYPINLEQFITRAQTDSYYSAYYGTSTMKSQLNGEVFNRQASFCGFWVLVLDDVGGGGGAKKSLRELPAAIRESYTYKIETSPDNYQLGFVLSTPVRELNAAKQLHRDVILALGTDSGGLMINKAVRLPCGFNLKKSKLGGYKYDKNGRPFECQLIDLTDKLWTPEDLRLAAGAVERKSTIVSTMSLRRDDVHFIASQGIIDPVFEWLVTQGLVSNEGVDWVTIECPFADDHSDPTQRTAGYSPLGYGENPHRRGFHCFHDSCSGLNTQDFLTWVYQMSGIRTSVHAGVAEYVARYAFITAQNSAVDMLSGDFAICHQVGLKNQLSGLVPVPAKKGNGIERVNEYVLYSTDPNRMRLNDLVYRPGEDLLIDRGGGSYPDLNLYQRVKWPRISFDADIIAPFIEFIRYLCPVIGDSEWLFNHLAAKAQNPQYRGMGVIMSTSVEKTGRATLERILRQLWSSQNVRVLALSKLLAGITSDENNRYILADWFIIPEAKERDTTARQEYRSYEALKQFVELNGVEVLIQEKWARAISVLCYGSVLICTNHADSIPTDLGSTRFRRIQNTRKPWPEAKWIEFYQWLQQVEWQPHVWSWLLERDISGHQLVVRSDPMSLRDEIIEAIQYEMPVRAALALCLLYANERWNGLLKVAWCISALMTVVLQLRLDSILNWEKVLKKELVNKTLELDWIPRIDGKRERLRTTPAYEKCRTLPEGFSQAAVLKELPIFVTDFINDEGL